MRKTPDFGGKTALVTGSTSGIGLGIANALAAAGANVMPAAQPTAEFVSIGEVADLAPYLCSDRARSITGTALPIDAGWTAQ